MNKKIMASASATALLFGCAAPCLATDEVNKWDSAGKKVKEASHAVADATVESTEKAVKDAHQAWEDAKIAAQESIDTAKKKYDQELEKARAKVHAATAPKDATEPEEKD